MFDSAMSVGVLAVAASPVVHACIERRGILSDGLSIERMIDGRSVAAEWPFSSSFREFSLRFQPELRAIPCRLPGGLPFVEGAKLNVFAHG
jgi:hypothetical protein